jgi:RHS repeat-associated protein
VAQPLRYAGYWYDRELGWYWLSVRAYDPVLERFLQPDPSMATGTRSYVYVGDDPADSTDPSGLTCYVSFNLPFVGRVSHAVPDAVCASPAPGALRAAVNFSNAAYQQLIGDDIDTLTSPTASVGDKAWAVVDIVSWVVPEDKLAKGGELGVAALKGIVEDATKLHDIPEPVLEQAAEDIGKGRSTLSDIVPKCTPCFPAGTLVATPHGEQAIQTLQVGQLVLAENPQSGTVEADVLQAVAVEPVQPLMTVELSDGSAITVTPNHAFWVNGGRLLRTPGWLQAKDLWLGDELRTQSGTGVHVIHLRHNVGRAVVYTLTVVKDHTFFVGMTRILVHNGSCDTLRYQYLGGTPRKASRTGREVIARMRREGLIRDFPGGTKVLYNDKWYPIAETDMSHIQDAVTWWNTVGRHYGAKADEVRAWMLDPNNYILEPRSANRSRGGQLTETYLPPVEPEPEDN